MADHLYDARSGRCCCTAAYPIGQLAEAIPPSWRFLPAGNSECPPKEELDKFTYTIIANTMLHEQLAPSTAASGLSDAHPMAVSAESSAALSAFYHDFDHITDPGAADVRQPPADRQDAGRSRRTPSNIPIGPPCLYPKRTIFSYQANFPAHDVRRPGRGTRDRSGDREERRRFDRIFILHADHEQNASNSR